MSWEGYKRAKLSDSAGVETVLDAFARHGCDRVHAAWICERESGWNPAARNKWGYTGLCQWSVSFLMDAGIDPVDFATWSRARQAPMVDRYLQAWDALLARSGRQDDFYVAFAYPAAIGSPDDSELAKVGSAMWRNNPGWRSPGDGPITTGSIRSYGGRPPADTGITPGGKGWNKPKRKPSWWEELLDELKRRAGEAAAPYVVPAVALGALYLLTSRSRRS